MTSMIPTAAVVPLMIALGSLCLVVLGLVALVYYQDGQRQRRAVVASRRPTVHDLKRKVERERRSRRGSHGQAL